jgi:four helix bundle protein
MTESRRPTKVLYTSPGESGKRGFEDLDCFKLALEVMVVVHEMVKTLPTEERYELISQVRRSSKSVTANLAEGYGRYHYLDSLHYYAKARGELNETLAHLINARTLSYINQSTFDSIYQLIRETEKAINGSMTYVRRQRAGNQEFGDKVIREEPVKYELEPD